MVLLTIKQLDEWMTANCYNDSYGIGSRIIHEGYGLDTADRLFVWYYTERGVRQNLSYFQTEKEAVDFAFRTITADRSANRHLVGFLKDKSVEQELIDELDRRGIAFWKDDIPYGGLHDRRSRIFVFGCDIQRVLNLQEKYLVRQ
ncbi:hypothetical protein [Spirosoma flavum]|uniref:Uncharacterized protein n=1 Tax=Spirosoma flavum TaxID=2048557 RepID=A0ABW6AHC5_9BACT